MRLRLPLLLGLAFAVSPLAPSALVPSAFAQAVGVAGFPLVPITGARRACVGGQATFTANGATYAFPCKDVDLMSFLPLASIGGGTNSASSGPASLATTWGWTDAGTGREYAILGRSDGTAFVDVTDALNPVYVGFLPRPAFRTDAPASPVAPSSWREIKVLGDVAAIVSESSGHGMQVFDLKGLRAFAGTPLTLAATARYAGLGRAHNVLVSEVSGTAVATGMQGAQTPPGCGLGLHFISLADPAAPAFAGCFNASPVNGSRGYTHDAQCVRYRGPDMRYTGREICLLSNERAVIVVDATNKAAITELGAATYPNVGYTHQGWLSEDQRTFYVDDELDESRGLVAKTRTLVIDVQRLDAPVLIGEFEGVTTAIDHNQYVRGAYSFQANYTAGVRIVDVSNPLALREAAFFDTFPANDAAQFDGIWNVYPYFASGNVVAGGIREGLFVIRPTKLALGTGPDEVPGRLGLRLTSANPARGAVRLELQLATAGAVRVAAYDALGREVARLADGERAAGAHPLTFDVAGLAQGLYFVRAVTPDGAVTRAVTVLR